MVVLCVEPAGASRAAVRPVEAPLGQYSTAHLPYVDGRCWAGVQRLHAQLADGKHPFADVIADPAGFPVRPPVPRAGAALLPQCGSCMARADSCCCWVCSDFQSNNLTGSIPPQLSSLSKLGALCARPCLIPV
jgi:hypothetical protein